MRDVPIRPTVPGLTSAMKAGAALNATTTNGSRLAYKTDKSEGKVPANKNRAALQSPNRKFFDPTGNPSSSVKNRPSSGDRGYVPQR